MAPAFVSTTMGSQKSISRYVSIWAINFRYASSFIRVVSLHNHTLNFVTSSSMVFISHSSPSSFMPYLLSGSVIRMADRRRANTSTFSSILTEVFLSIGSLMTGRRSSMMDLHNSFSLSVLQNPDFRSRSNREPTVTSR